MKHNLKYSLAERGIMMEDAPDPEVPEYCPCCGISTIKIETELEKLDFWNGVKQYKGHKQFHKEQRESFLDQVIYDLMEDRNVIKRLIPKYIKEVKKNWPDEFTENDIKYMKKFLNEYNFMDHNDI